MGPTEVYELDDLGGTAILREAAARRIKMFNCRFTQCLLDRDICRKQIAKSSLGFLRIVDPCKAAISMPTVQELAPAVRRGR